MYIYKYITPVDCEKLFGIVRSFITEAFLLMYVLKKSYVHHDIQCYAQWKQYKYCTYLYFIGSFSLYLRVLCSNEQLVTFLCFFALLHWQFFIPPPPNCKYCTVNSAKIIVNQALNEFLNINLIHTLILFHNTL
jgi:hypothetical protein